MARVPAWACTAGHGMLLPLTQSLYVNGKIGATDKVMIDIGTGYFAEVRRRTHAVSDSLPLCDGVIRGVESFHTP